MVSATHMSVNLALVILFSCALAETHALGDSRQEAELQQCTTKECATNTDPTSLLMTRQSVSELSGHHAMKDMELDQTMSAKSIPTPQAFDVAEKIAAEQDGYVIKYSKRWPHCKNIVCPGTKTRAEYGRMCEGYDSLCTGFSFTHGYGSNQRGSGCLKKCGATEFGGFGTGNNDYWAKPEAPTPAPTPAPTTPAPTPAEFIILPLGTSVCPTGYRWILELSNCLMALFKLDYKYDDLFQKHSLNSPHFCVCNQYGKGYFRPGEPGPQYEAPICEKVTTTVPCPPLNANNDYKCGHAYGRCHRWGWYCNEINGQCVHNRAHKEALVSDMYDYYPYHSCNQVDEGSDGDKSVDVGSDGDKSAEYVKPPLGTRVCPFGYRWILELSNCLMALFKLDYKYDDFYQKRSSNSPHFCVWNERFGKGYFRPQGIGENEPICEKVTTTVPCPPLNANNEYELQFKCGPAYGRCQWRGRYCNEINGQCVTNRAHKEVSDMYDNYPYHSCNQVSD